MKENLEEKDPQNVWDGLTLMVNVNPPTPLSKKIFPHRSGCNLVRR